ncbi:hypothetical protein GS597_01385 [Synechococcales cyanobacterium C]|uniref:Uncharacterized protein n=1 Tax=Petrachloros mirabilis ULC683 TaxID=2781853 RepID=A0A8K1ZWJ5_9CYAN|nr:hypothetical protein [Petrachloros mirabilis]NCJ05192.1 hypothetical protein [Petrachloros mirabilis ULC683]
MIFAYQAPPQPPTAPQPVVAFPLEAIILTSILGILSAGSGALGWFAVRMINFSEKRIERLEAEARRIEREAHDLRLNVAANYVHNEDFTRQSMVTNAGMERLAEQISQIFVALEGIRKES